MMKQVKHILTRVVLLSLIPMSLFSQSVGNSVSTGVQIDNASKVAPKVRGENENKMGKKESVAWNETVSASVGWTRVVYKTLDLEKEPNSTLGYPEHKEGGAENLFRIIVRLLSEGTIAGYEFLDGKEVFTPEFKVNVAELLDRFHIPYQEEAGLIEIDDADVPSSEVLSYYIIEEWEFDTRQNRTVARVLALCPVIHGGGYFGEGEVRYPFAWIAMEELQPYLSATTIFIDDADNTPRYTYNDFFALNLYDGEIFKTRNLRNKTMAELYPDEDERRHAADSIQRRLESFDKMLWAPSREEVIEARKAREEHAASLGQVPVKQSSRQSERKPVKRSSRGTKPAKENTSVVRSVKDRK